MLRIGTSKKHRLEQVTSESTSFDVSNAIDSPVVDIVFVHGFGGQCTGTWTSEGICWPRDFLRPKLKRARIAFFGYDAALSKFLPRSNDSNSVSEYASELLRHLTEWRVAEGACNRAFIFVAHSIGSIVVKDALCHLSSESTQVCRGAVFLGAPHRDTGKASFGQIAARAAAAIQPSLTSEVIRELEGSSDILDQLNDAFVKYMERRGGTFKAITFYEESVVPILREIVVERESAIIENLHHHSRGLKADHSSICKFVQRDDPNYVKISGAIVRIYEDIQPRRTDCELLFNPLNALWDVVFVHSLGCNNMTSWTFDKTYWPKSFLPADLPYARIIAYNYETDFTDFMKSGQSLMVDLANEFLLSLLKVRHGVSSNNGTRPILFIAHSIGGTLVKQVLNVSRLTVDPNLRSISDATKGILFFGAPHQGDGLTIGTITTKAILSALPNIGRDVINAIKKDSAFEQINRAFLDHMSEKDIHIVSFYSRRSSLFNPIATTSVSLANQHLAYLSSSRAELGQFSERSAYIDVVKQIWDITGPQAIGRGCIIVHNPTNVQIDVVFVPGLRAGADLAWTDESVCWPRDLLPCDLQDARIIIYGYNADASDFFRMKGENSLFLCSRELLSNLSEIRVGDASNRPMMFVAHSCGGLLVKNAITQSHRANDLRTSDIAACLHGVIFLGTPHDQHVSDSKKLRKFVANLFHLGQSLPTKQEFKQTTKVIRDVTTRFTEIISTQKNGILFRNFFEEDPMPNVGVVVDKFSGDLDRSLPTNHVGMPKVKSRDCEGYQRILLAIQEVYDHSKSSVASHVKSGGGEGRGDTQAIHNVPLITSRPEAHITLDFNHDHNLQTTTYNISDDPDHNKTNYGIYSNHGYHVSGQDIIINYTYNPSNALEELMKHCSPNAAFNSAARFDPPRCTESTRLRIIQIIEDWVYSDKGKPGSSSLFWLYGGAGAGKSALAQSLSEKFHNNGLAASFCFFRNDPTRNNGNQLIPTLVSQLVDTCREIIPFIEDRIWMEKNLFSKTYDIQIQELLVQPLLSLKSRQSVITPPRLIIIDGLDECGSPDAQGSLLRAVARAIPQIPYPLRFLITSRPEAHITHVFNHNIQTIPLHRYNLSDDPDADMDIRKFLENEFADIHRVHPLAQYLPPSWPGPKSISSLVEQSSGHFIYPSTVIRYIRSPKHRPDDRLGVILRLRPPYKGDQPYAQLDTSYALIFEGVHDHDQLEKICVVLGLLCIQARSDFFSLSYDRATIEAMLEMKDGDLVLLLDPILSLITIDGRLVRILHKSLFDFLLDSTRRGNLPFDLARAHESAATYLLNEKIAKRVCDISDLRIFAFHCQYAYLNNALKGYLHSLEVPFPTSITIPKTFLPWTGHLNLTLRETMWYFCRTLSREDFDYTGKIYERYVAKWIAYLKDIQARGFMEALKDGLNSKLKTPNSSEINVSKLKFDKLVMEWKPRNTNLVDERIDPVKRLVYIKHEHNLFSAFIKASFSDTDVVTSSLVLGNDFIYSYQFATSGGSQFLNLQAYSRRGNPCFRNSWSTPSSISFESALENLEKYLSSEVYQQYGLL